MGALEGSGHGCAERHRGALTLARCREFDERFRNERPRQRPRLRKQTTLSAHASRNRLRFLNARTGRSRPVSLAIQCTIWIFCSIETGEDFSKLLGPGHRIRERHARGTADPLEDLLEAVPCHAERPRFLQMLKSIAAAVSVLHRRTDVVLGLRHRTSPC